MRKLIVAILCCISISCVNNPTDTTKDMDSEDTASVASASEIYRIVRETLLYWDSVSPDNNVKIVSLQVFPEDNPTDSLHWLMVFPLPCYDAASSNDYLEFFDTKVSEFYSIIDGKLTNLVLDSFMLSRNESSLEFVNPESFPEYKKCDGEFYYDPLIWYYCLRNDSFKLRHIGYYLPEKIRKGNFKDTLPEFPYPLNSKP